MSYNPGQYNPPPPPLGARSYDYPFLRRKGQNPGLFILFIIRILALLGGMGFCLIMGLYCLGIWGNLVQGDESLLSHVIAGSYSQGLILCGIGFMYFLSSLCSAISAMASRSED